MLIFHHLFTLTGWVLAMGVLRLQMQTYYWSTRWREGQHEIRLCLQARDYFSSCCFWTMVTNAIIAEIFIIFSKPFPQIQTKIQSEYALLFKEKRSFLW